MATATTAREIAALTQALRADQQRSATALATVLALYYLRQTDPQSESSVQRWIDLVLARVRPEHDRLERQAAAYLNRLRPLEVQGGPRVTASPANSWLPEALEKSLRVVGPQAHLNKMTEISRLDVPDVQKRALFSKAQNVARVNIAGTIMRHTQDGARQTIYQNTAQDQKVLGWVRVTREWPCYFCAMLASRGIEYRPFDADSFEASNSRFTGIGTAKVHDHCACNLKPVYREKDDPLVEASQRFAKMWRDYSEGSGQEAVRSFRKAYNAALPAAV